MLIQGRGKQIMDEYSSHVRYAAGRAEIQIGDKSFTVERRDSQNNAYGCPIELIIGALGS